MCRWAILKDEKVAKKMMKFVELNTIGVSHDSQVRATQIVKSVVQGYAYSSASNLGIETQTLSSRSLSEHVDNNKLFHFGASVMHYRWRRLRNSLSGSSEFSIPEFQPSYCNFFQKQVNHAPGMHSHLLVTSSMDYLHKNAPSGGLILVGWNVHSICVAEMQKSGRL